MPQRFDIQTEARQSSRDKRAICKLGFHRRVLTRDAAHQNHRALGIDKLGQALGTVERLARKRQQFDPAGVNDVVVVHHAVP
jgi:hypothetical protein